MLLQLININLINTFPGSMISIITCVRHTERIEPLREHIRSTIGVEHELIAIDNSTNQYSIFQAYNKGVELSRFPFLLFMHDDIWYHTNDWGQKLVAHFESPETGAIGICGTPYIAWNAGGWWSPGEGYLHILQSQQRGMEPEMHDFAPAGGSYQPFGQVVALDGVWFCIRKSLFEKIRFDDQTYSGFHLYDVDTTLQVHQLGYKLWCIKDILIHHESAGSLDASWIKHINAFQEKWKGKLPASCVSMSRRHQAYAEYRVINEFAATRIKLEGTTKSIRRKVYANAIKQLLSFPVTRFYHQTPVWILRFLKQLLKA